MGWPLYQVKICLFLSPLTGRARRSSHIQFPIRDLKAEVSNQPGKVDDYPVKVLIRDLDRLGYKKVNGKCDQENAITAVCKAVKATWKGEWIQEFSPKYEHQPNGEVERAVQTIHGLARTLKDHVEQYARIELDPKSPMIAWIIEHAATLHYLFHRSEDGMTPYQRVKGKEWTISLPAIGETVDYKQKTRHKLEMRWDRGIFLGVKIDSSERIVGTEKGTFVVQSIRRVPEAERYNSDAIIILKGHSLEASARRAR